MKKGYNTKGELVEVNEKDYNKFHLHSTNGIEYNILIKKGFLEKHFYKILFLVFIVAILIRNWNNISITFNYS
jgi:hypothetical protein